MRDSLTGLEDRRFATEEIARVLERARGSSQPFSVVLLGMDETAAENGGLGRVAMTLRTALRSTDALARYGRCEFLLVVSERDHPYAQRLVDRVLGVVKDRTRALVSAGIVSWPEHGGSVGDLLESVVEHLKVEQHETADTGCRR